MEGEREGKERQREGEVFACVSGSGLRCWRVLGNSVLQSVQHSSGFRVAPASFLPVHLELENDWPVVFQFLSKPEL